MPHDAQPAHQGSITIEPRFCGPDDSANGGYFAGRVASFADQIVTVRLMRPPPLDTALEVQRHGELLEVRSDNVLVGVARPATLDLVVPQPPTYMEAFAAVRKHRDYADHPYRRCFVCGPAREAGDGLRIFAGQFEPGKVAAPWIPDVSLAGADGKIKPEFMWAALDCPGYFAVTEGGRTMLLGELTAHVDRLVHADEACVVLGWRIGPDPEPPGNRRYEAGTAIFDEDGELCARARATWIEVRAK